MQWSSLTSAVFVSVFMVKSIILIGAQAPFMIRVFLLRGLSIFLKFTVQVSNFVDLSFFFFFHFIAFVWEGCLSGKKMLAQGNSKRIVVRSCHILCYASQVFFTYFGAATTILCWNKNLKGNKQQNKVYSFCNPPSFSVIPWANFCNRGDGWFLLGTHGRNQNLGRILLLLHCILSNKITNTILTIRFFSWIFNIFFLLAVSTQPINVILFFFFVILEWLNRAKHPLHLYLTLPHTSFDHHSGCHSLCYHLVLSHSVLSDSMWPSGLQPTRLLFPLSMGFSRQEPWIRCHFLLQGIFPTQEARPCFL